MPSSLLIETTIAVVSLLDETYLAGVHSSGLLTHPLRHRLMAILLNQPQLHRTELAELLADDSATAETSTSDIEIQLHHNHLPRLDEAMLVDYDYRTGDLRLWEDSETTAELLEAHSIAEHR